MRCSNGIIRVCALADQALHGPPSECAASHHVGVAEVSNSEATTMATTQSCQGGIRHRSRPSLQEDPGCSSLRQGILHDGARQCFHDDVVAVDAGADVSEGLLAAVHRDHVGGVGVPP